TDALIFLLVAVLLAFTWQLRRHEHLRAPWRRVMASRSGMSAAVVLAVLLFVGFLDCLHFRAALPADSSGRSGYAAEVQSVLDLALKPLRTRNEKTYSAPLATHLYAMETIQREDGTQA